MLTKLTQDTLSLAVLPLGVFRQGATQNLYSLLASMYAGKQIRQIEQRCVKLYGMTLCEVSASEPGKVDTILKYALSDLFKDNMKAYVREMTDSHRQLMAKGARDTPFDYSKMVVHGPTQDATMGLLCQTLMPADMDLPSFWLTRLMSECYPSAMAFYINLHPHHPFWSFSKSTGMQGNNWRPYLLMPHDLTYVYAKLFHDFYHYVEHVIGCPMSRAAGNRGCNVLNVLTRLTEARV